MKNLSNRIICLSRLRYILYNIRANVNTIFDQVKHQIFKKLKLEFSIEVGPVLHFAIWNLRT